MSVESLIASKVAGHHLTNQQIQRIVDDVCNPDMPDELVSAFTKAVYTHGMSLSETAALTDAMRKSGLSLDWSLNGPVVDKHSTGGVGDLVSLVLAPLLAACGCYVPMISGRCLGHTGGTIDKLESIPGYQVQPELDTFRACVERNGVAIIAQSDNLAPADQRLYAMRNANNTVDSLPLIVSSILSKKLAEGLDALILDIKVGSGAWFATEQDAQPIKEALKDVAESLGVKTHCVLSSMDSPISHTVGNALEVREAIAFLTNQLQHPVLKSLVYDLACDVLVLCGQQENKHSAMAAVERALTCGDAAERFASMVRFLGGPSSLIDNPLAHLTRASVVKPVQSESSGVIHQYNMKRLGQLSHQLSRVSSRDCYFDHSTGICELPLQGTTIEKGQPIAEIHASCEADWQMAKGVLLSECVTIAQSDNEAVA